LEEEDLPDVGLITIHQTIKYLGPVIKKVKRRKQGNLNPDSPWAKERLRWVTQLLVMLGKREFNPSTR
jgi:hypothetical protein